MSAKLPFAPGTRVSLSLKGESGFLCEDTTIITATRTSISIRRPSTVGFALEEGGVVMVAVDDATDAFRFVAAIERVGVATATLRLPDTAAIVGGPRRDAPRAKVFGAGKYARVEGRPEGDPQIAMQLSDPPPSSLRPCLVEDISASGMLIRTSRALFIDELVHVSFSLPGQGMFALLARVVRLASDDDPAGYGARLVCASEADTTRIAAYVQSKLESTASGEDDGD